MTAKVIDGKRISENMLNALKKEINEMDKKPCLATVLIGDNPASKLYVNKKEEACKFIGIDSKKLVFSDDIKETELIDAIHNLNNDENITGILIQLPLPTHMNQNSVFEAISPSKDVDGFNPLNVGNLLNGNEKLVSCTPKGIIRILEQNNIEINGKNVVIIGQGYVVGRPLAALCMNRDATVISCNDKTKNLREFTLKADILVSAAGVPKLVKGDMVKSGAVVIDVGINKVDGKLCGDVDFKDVKEKASYLTPVPGGVGPMTVAILMENTVCVAKGMIK